MQDSARVGIINFFNTAKAQARKYLGFLCAGKRLDKICVS